MEKPYEQPASIDLMSAFLSKSLENEKKLEEEKQIEKEEAVLDKNE